MMRWMGRIAVGGLQGCPVADAVSRTPKRHVSIALAR